MIQPHSLGTQLYSFIYLMFILKPLSKLYLQKDLSLKIQVYSSSYLGSLQLEIPQISQTQPPSGQTHPFIRPSSYVLCLWNDTTIHPISHV